MKEVNEQEFYDFLASFNADISMRSHRLFHPVTILFYHDDKRVATVIIHVWVKLNI